MNGAQRLPSKPASGARSVRLEAEDDGMVPWLLPWMLSPLSVALAAGTDPDRAAMLQLPPDARGAFAVYCATACAPAPPTLPEGTLPSRAARQSTLALERWGDDFRFPDAEQIQDWGQGDLRGLHDAREVVVITWAAPRTAAASTVHAAGQAALEMGQWFEDLDTGVLYDAEAFRAALARYEGRHPDVTALLLLEAATLGTEDDAVRLVTRGMGKLGLPELVLSDVPASEVSAAGLLLNATAQALHEGAAAGPPGLWLDLDGGALRASAVRTLACGVQGEVTLAPTTPTASDPLGPLYALTFAGEVAACSPSSAAPTPLAAVSTTPTTPMTLSAARSAALLRLQGPVRAAFAAGLPPGEALLIKARFTAPGGESEWLWVQVRQWRADGQVVGALASPPTLQPGLRRGAEVEIRLTAADTFDYLWMRADGRHEGNTTQAFLTRP